ncbi:MAG: hypothetical protein HY727_03660 [Candidatus Rokubacteria bacterium]|nr:hypothetical protein [Candidatus Rokubacteria bacterium]
MAHWRVWIGAAAVALLAWLEVAAGAGPWTAPLPTDKVENGVNWTSQFMYARGVGVAPPTATSPEHARALAVTAGTALARQELLAIARGVAIDGRTTVQALMVTSAITEARVSGVIRGAQVVETRDLGGGAVEVTVAVPATGEFADVVLPRPAGPKPPAPVAAPAPAPAPVPPVLYSGLVIDARGLGVRPAMAPKVVSEGGQEIYGFSVVDRNWVVQQGMVGYSKDPGAARAHERVADRPLIVKAVAAAGASKTDVVISNDDAKLLLGSGPHLAFLEKARVMFVVD